MERLTELILVCVFLVAAVDLDSRFLDLSNIGALMIFAITVYYLRKRTNFFRNVHRLVVVGILFKVFTLWKRL